MNGSDADIGRLAARLGLGHLPYRSFRNSPVRRPAEPVALRQAAQPVAVEPRAAQPLVAEPMAAEAAPLLRVVSGARELHVPAFRTAQTQPYRVAGPVLPDPVALLRSVVANGAAPPKAEPPAPSPPPPAPSPSRAGFSLVSRAMGQFVPDAPVASPGKPGEPAVAPAAPEQFDLLRDALKGRGER